MQLSILEIILILLMTSIVVSGVFRILKLPVIVGYLIVGVVVGPFMMQVIPDNQDIKDLAEFGVVFLMFTIGLEFSLSKMLEMRKTVFLYGGLQVLLTTIATALVGIQFDMSLSEVLIVGGIVALSSTAIVLKQLNDQGDLYLPHGLNAVGILLFQDLAVIPLLILIPSLQNIELIGLGQELGWATLKGILALVIILSFGRWVLRPAFYSIGKIRSLEIFTLLTLLVTLGSAWLTHLLGLSLALGAFLAGMMLGETEFKHQIETDIRPFKDVLLGFFFITIGIQLDLHVVIGAWPWVILLLLALIIFKTILIFCITYVFERNTNSAFRTGLILAQGGEFGFAILSLALSYSVLPEAYAQVILCALLLSMTLAPIIIRYNEKISHLFFRKGSFSLNDTINDIKAKDHQKLRNHVIICGYGRVGQTIARFLDKADIKYIALELDSDIVKEAVSKNENVLYADSTHHEILELVNIKDARAIVFSFCATQKTSKIITLIRQSENSIPIIARTNSELEIHDLYQQGATEVITDSLESSLMLSAHVLFLLKIDPTKVLQWIADVQHNRYDLIRMIHANIHKVEKDSSNSSHLGMHTVKLNENAFAVGKTISELNIFEQEIQITALRRKTHRLQNPTHNTVFQNCDIIVLYGPVELLQKAELVLLYGKN